MNMIKVYTTRNELEANALIGQLQRNNINVYVHQKNTEEYMKIIWGFPANYINLFVNEEDYKEAKEIIQDFLDSSKFEKENFSIPWYRNHRLIAALILL